MGWIHDTGYEPAYTHEGFVASVLDDGTEPDYVSTELNPRVTGWRAACECGWRSARILARAEWPDSDGWPPAELEDDLADGGCHAEWRQHLRTALPDLFIYDAARKVQEATTELHAAVIDARAAGTTWDRIGQAAGISRQSANERWGELVRQATDPVPLDGPPADGELDDFGRDILRRCRIARRENGGPPAGVWSTGEQLAVALVLRDHDHLDAMGYTPTEAAQRVLDGATLAPHDFNGCLDRIRTDL